MNHRRRMWRQLQDYQTGVVTGRRSARLRRHIETCQVCRQTLDTWAETGRLIRTSVPEHSEISPRSADAIFNRAFALATAAPSREPLLARRVIRSGVVVAVSAAALILWRVVGIKPATHSGTPGVVAAFPPKQVPAKFPSPGGPDERQVHASTPLPKRMVRWNPAARRYGIAHNRKASERICAAISAPLPDIPFMAEIPQDPPEDRVALDSSEPPAISISVTLESEETPGYASARTFFPGASGGGTWVSCATQSTPTGTTQTRYQEEADRPGELPSSLLIIASSRAPEAEKGMNP